MQKQIKKFFNNHPSISIKPKELSKKLYITEPHEYASLKDALHKLYKSGWLDRVGKRYFKPAASDNKTTGTLQLSHEGNYGFVLMKNEKLGDIFIPEKYLSTAFNGDTVEVELLAKKRGKNPEGKVIDIVSRARTEIVGVLEKAKSFYFVLPDDKKIHRDIYIPEDALNGAKNGDKVCVSNIEWTNPLLNPEGEITSVLGKAGSYDAEIASIAHEIGLTFKFPENVLREAEKISLEIPTDEIKKRLDLRDELIVTIDPDDAKDFDDAVSLKRLPNKNFELGVHIADVSHYVNIGSHIYEEALNRANSVYLVGKVIPMIPERLSNVICSLVPDEDRLTYSVISEITPQGKVENYKIAKSIIRSKRRYTYKEVQKILDEGSGENVELLQLLNNLAKNLRRKRMEKGSINFYTPEVEFKLNEDGVPLTIEIKKLLESHNLIEEFMLLANQIVANHIIKNNKEEAGNFVYRVHDLPEPDRLNEFAKFVKSLGFSFNASASNNSKQFQQLLEQVKGTDEDAVVNGVAIRAMAKAVYTTDNIGHYGLGFENYSHFTSPIRRFADLVVHILLADFAKDFKINSYSHNELEEICTHISAQERKAINAERLSVKMKQMEYLQNKLGHEFLGIISGITNFGFFVELKDTLSEGLVRLGSLENDYYILDEKNHSLIGRDTGKRYRLGDKVYVKLERVDNKRREVDFSIVDQ
ncbi:MAG: ribonuclease R [Bacteroidetes bacterium]|nr:ribonuclease R [Bacteroidota bacterium]